MRSLASAASSALVVLLALPGAFAADEPYWDSRPLSHWLAVLRDGDLSGREQAAGVIEQMAIAHGPDRLVPAVPLLLTSLDEPAASLRAAAAGALEQVGPAAQGAVPRLLAMFGTDPEPGVRRRAGLALSRISPAATGVVTAAARALEGDDDPGVQEAAVVVLLMAGPAAASARATLHTVADAADWPVRVYAAAALGHLGEDKTAVAVLLAALAQEDPVVRAEAAGLLGDVAPAHAVPPLTEALSDPDPLVRSAAADALGVIGAPADPAVPALWRLVRDPNEAVREGAIRAIRRIRP